MTENQEMIEALHSSATVASPPEVECGNHVWDKAWPWAQMCLLHLNSSICFPIWHALHYLRHNLKLCSCCHSKSSSKSSKEGEARIVGECRALIILCMGMGTNFSCITQKYKTKPVLAQEGPGGPWAGEQSVGTNISSWRKVSSFFQSCISKSIELFSKYKSFVDRLGETQASAP